MYRIFTGMPGESYRKRLGSLLLYLCYLFRVLIGDVSQVEFMYLAFIYMPGESYRGDSGLCCCICVTYFER